jgi:hypothetical protein
VVDRVVRDPAITESSGLAPSLRHRGVLWTLNDSGGQPVLFGVGADGRTVARLRVRHMVNQDWEAVATTRDRSGRPVILIADTGNNAADRDSVQVVVVPEPARLRDATVRPAVVVHLRYPPGPVPDTEALLADPRDGRLVLVTKGIAGGVGYAVPSGVWPGPVPTTGVPGTSGVRSRSGSAPERTPTRWADLVRLTRVGLSAVTDGTMLADGRVVLRSYSWLVVLPPVREWTGRAVAPVLTSVSLPNQQQGESLTVVDGVVLVGSEGPGQPVLRIPVPGIDLTATGFLGGGDRPMATVDGDRAGPTSGVPGGWASTVGVLVVLVVLALSWVGIRRGRRGCPG